jgi:predicted amino acid racemase
MFCGDIAIAEVYINNGIHILGASSDQLMIDITESRKTYEVGDIIEFKLGYFATMCAFTP